MMNKNNHSISIRQGIRAAFFPALAFLMIQPASAQTQWVTNGNNINNTNTGNVGIGMTTPFAKLDVMAPVGSTAGIFRGDISSGNEFSGQFYLYTSGPANTRVRIGFGDSASGAGISQIESARYPGGGGYLAFRTRLPGDSSMVERMRIDNSGNVGIGSISPSTRLSITPTITEPKITLWDGGSTSSHFGFGISDNQLNYHVIGGGNHVFYQGGKNGDGTPLMIIKSTGNVGIGTTNPWAPLHVVGSIFSSGPIGGYSFQDRTSERVWAWYGIGDTARFYSGNKDIIGITPAGNVGIGTTAPMTALHVVGDVTVNSTGSGTGNITATGTVTAGNIVAKYQDIAEWVPSLKAMPAGTVVVLDTVQLHHVMASSQAYDTRVAGVVSERPGLILGEGGEGKLMVATTGRVRVKVDATRAPIRAGDILVTSDREGIAMRSEPIDLGGARIHRPGTIIGKALEPLDKGIGEILVLLSLQ